MGLSPFVIFWRRSKSPMVVIDNVKLLIVYYIFCDKVTNMVTDIVAIALLLALLPALLLFIQSPRTKAPFWQGGRIKMRSPCSFLASL